MNSVPIYMLFISVFRVGMAIPNDGHIQLWGDICKSTFTEVNSLIKYGTAPGVSNEKCSILECLLIHIGIINIDNKRYNIKLTTSAMQLHWNETTNHKRDCVARVCLLVVKDTEKQLSLCKINSAIAKCIFNKINDPKSCPE